jgi:two-component system, chemotaxis family, CheB/CheR fusion protein
MAADEKSSQDFNELIVVGSSAGGIEALSVLVGSLPKDFPAPVVLAQHLDPHRTSNLDTILERRSTLPIVLVQDSIKLQSGKIYVVPANRHVAIRDGLVRLEGDYGNRPRPSVDLLLTSAAEVYGERLIALILTGSGSDGAAGAVEVKKAGGTVIIQNPETARYPSMPLALPPTAVDHIADLEMIGQLLYDLVKGVELPKPQEKVEDALRDVLLQVNRVTNIDFRPYKPSTILRRISRRMAVTHNANLRDYAKYLEEHPEEVAELVMAFLIMVTEFFRDVEAFGYLKKNILPQMIERARAGDRVLRFWSVGCATGEEPYSLAILVADLLGAELPQWTIRIFATDLDEGAINFARRGLYPPNVLENMPEGYRERFFERVDHGYRISKTLRQMVIFGHQDLSRGVPFPRIDLVVCRNLLIYFKPELQQHVLELFAFSLHHTNGHLFLGKAETVHPSKALYEQVDKRLKVFRCVRSPQPNKDERGVYGMPRSWMNLHGQEEGGQHIRRHRVKVIEREAPWPDGPGELEIELGELRRFNELVFRFLPSGVVVIDRHYRILTANGNARRLLQFRDLAHDQDFLHTVRSLPYGEVRTAIDHVFREHSQVTLPELSVDSLKTGEERYLSMRIAPMQIESGPVDLAIITIEDITGVTQTRWSLEVAQEEQKYLVDELSSTNARLSELNKEMQDANEELQAANEEMMLAQEELQATNEELEATNEELQATNEELETNNEELQATNEELETTNEELTERSNELNETAKSLADERVRLMEMIELAPFYIMVLRGQGLLIEAFNEYSAGLLGGREVIGQPFAEVFEDPESIELVNLVREVYRQDQSRTTRRIRTQLPNEQGGMVESYVVYTVVPTHDSDGKVNGVVIYAEDVTEQRAKEMAERLEHLKLMVENVEQVALGLYDAETSELLQASPHYLHILERAHGYPSHEMFGRKFRELTFIVPREQADELFKSALQSRSPLRLSEVPRKLAADETETVWNWNLIPILNNPNGDNVRFVLVSAIEITEQVKAREQLEQLDHIKDQFFSLASHELRTPLVPLAGYAEMISRLAAQTSGDSDRDQRLNQMATKVRKQIKHLERFADDLLDVARLQSGKFSLKGETVDLIEVVKQAIEESKIMSPDHTIRLDVQNEHPPVVTGDPDRLVQVITNLLSNAIKHAPESRVIDVRINRADETSDLLQIEVQDYGQGIRPENLETIFNRFYQITTDNSKSRSGLGLGLYIARGIIEQHSGTIIARSKAGEGSTFIINLPPASTNQ